MPRDRANGMKIKDLDLACIKCARRYAPSQVIQHSNCGMVPPPSGYGPWWVFLVSNEHPNPVKKTDIRIHTYWRLLLRAMNTEPRCQWVPIMVIGSFTSWKAALRFKDLWEGSTRNLRNRIDQGWVLFQQWQQRYELSIQFQPLQCQAYRDSQGWNDAAGPVGARGVPTPTRSGRREATAVPKKRKRKIAYRKIIGDPTKERVTMMSIHSVESKRKCLGGPPKRGDRMTVKNETQ